MVLKSDKFLMRSETHTSIDPPSADREPKAVAKGKSGGGVARCFFGQLATALAPAAALAMVSAPTRSTAFASSK